MPAITERDVNHLIEDFDSFLNDTCLELNNNIQMRDLACSKVIEHSDEILHELETLTAGLKEIVPADIDLSLLGIKEYLRSKAEEKCRLRDITLEEKLKKKTTKSVTYIRMSGIKKEIEKLNDDNEQLEAQINNPELPLVLKLMSSKDI